MTELRECPFCGGAPCKDPQETDVRGSTGRYMMAIWCESCGVVGPTQDDGQAAISAWNRRADGWQPIETAPRDGTEVLVYATMPDHLQWTDPDKQLRPIVRVTAWHHDAGWCVDELREAIMWRPLSEGPR